MRSRKTQRGVALLLALVLVALVTIIAYDIWFSGSLEQRRAFASLSLERGLQYGIGAEAAAAKLLLLDSQQNGAQDYPAEQWAQPFPPTTFGDALVEGRLEDMEGRFNLNSLIDKTTGTVNPDRVDQFRRLLQIVGLETKWADLLVDWLDSDDQPTFPDGGEDNLYTLQAPPYLPPNTAITSPSELMALPGFGIERYRRLEPYVAALPSDARLNVCFAPGPVLDSLSTGQTQFQDAAWLAKQRDSKCFPTVQTLGSTMPAADFSKLAGYVVEKTSYFRLTSVTTIGTAQFTLYSLLRRSKGGLVQPIIRNWGSD